MKKINTSNVTSTSRQPLLGRSVTHLKEGTMENDDSLVKAILEGISSTTYTTNVPLILFGCVNTGNLSGAGLPYAISAGAIYYNGEIYQVAAASGTITGANVVLLTITTTYQMGDPVTMTDGSLKNVHEIVTMNVSENTSGSGTADFSSAVRISTYAQKIATQINLATQTTSSTSYVDATGLTYTFAKAGRYTVEFKGWTNSTINSANVNQIIDGGGIMQIWNNTTSAELDVTNTYIAFNSAGIDVYDIDLDGSFFLKAIVTVSAGDVIKCRFKKNGSWSTDVSLESAKFYVTEI